MPTKVVMMVMGDPVRIMALDASGLATTAPARVTIHEHEHDQRGMDTRNTQNALVEGDPLTVGVTAH